MRIRTTARWLKPVFVATVVALVVSGCANFNTVSRTTSLGSGKAIHLDVQQRLVIYNAKKFCAEPSPDALAAYAAAMGVGVSAPQKGALSTSGSGQSSAASIGLRTQSITLMRDTLYRMCEAYANGGISDSQVVTLLNRSQDLTAVILAVEQLTGAVAANQAALTGSTSSSSFATALNNSKLLAEATAHEERMLTRLEESKAQLASANDKFGEANAAFEKSDAALKVLEDANNNDKEKVADAKAVVAYRKKLRDAAENSWKDAVSRVELRQRAYDSAQSAVDEISKRPDSSSSAGTAGTTGNSEYSTPTPRMELSKEATEAVSGAVKDIVLEALKKEYVLDSCMSVITSTKVLKTEEEKELQKQTNDYCRGLVSALVLEKTNNADTRVEAATLRMTKKVTSDVGSIMGCLAPDGKFDTARRNQLFLDADAKDSGKLDYLKSTALKVSDASEFRTLLGQVPNLRAAMAAVVASSEACK